LHQIQRAFIIYEDTSVGISKQRFHTQASLLNGSDPKNVVNRNYV